MHHCTMGVSLLPHAYAFMIHVLYINYTTTGIFYREFHYEEINKKGQRKCQKNPDRSKIRGLRLFIFHEKSKIISTILMN